MLHVDFFSRNLIPSVSRILEPRVESKRIDITELLPNWLQVEQQRDVEICKIITDLEENKLDENLAKTYVIRSGILHRKIQRYGRSKCLPYLPRSLRWSVVNNFHDSYRSSRSRKDNRKVI